MDGGAWWAAVHGVAQSHTRLCDFTSTFPFPALEKEMATHSSVLAWRLPGTGEPGGLPSMGSHRVGHWSDLAAAAAVASEARLQGKGGWGSTVQRRDLLIAYWSNIFQLISYWVSLLHYINTLMVHFLKPHSFFPVVIFSFFFSLLMLLLLLTGSEVTLEIWWQLSTYVQTLYIISGG